MLALVAGMMRSGSVLTYQLTRGVIRITPDAQAPRLIEADMLDGNEWRAWAKRRSWVAYKTHVFVPIVGECAHENPSSVRVICSIRNLRDALVSLSHFSGRPVGQILDAGQLETNLWHIEDWLRGMPRECIMLVRYEDFYDDLPRFTARIAGFLGIRASFSDLELVARSYTSERNILRAIEGHPIDSEEYMAKRHIHSGKVGQWKSELKPEEVERIAPLEMRYAALLDGCERV